MNSKLVILPAMALAAAGVSAQDKVARRDIKKEANPNRLNVVFIISDQMSALALPLYGNQNIKTPNMDRLAREGVVFENSVCVVPFSSPARASFATGLYPTTHGIMSNVKAKETPNVFDTRDIPYTEKILYSVGYTNGWYGKWHLGVLADYPCFKDNSMDSMDKKILSDTFDQAKKDANPSGKPQPARKGEVIANAKTDCGFGFYQTEYMYDKAKNAPQNMSRKVSSIGRQGIPVELNDWTSLTKQGLDFITRNKERNFTTTISLGPPHPNFEMSDPYYSAIDPAKIVLQPSYKDAGQYQSNMNSKIGFYIGEEGTREKMRCYYAQIMYVDEMIGRILKCLDDNGLSDKTLVIFTADHGDPMSSHGMLYGKTIDGFVEELLRTPTLMRLPGAIPAGKRIKAHINSVDFAPTILDYLGQTPPASMQGKSMRPVIEGKVSDQVGFSFSMRPNARCVRGEVDGKIYSYTRVFSGNVREELYNVTDDPFQMKEISRDKKYAKVIATMKQAFDEHAEKHNDKRIDRLSKADVRGSDNE